MQLHVFHDFLETFISKESRDFKLFEPHTPRMTDIFHLRHP